MSLDTKIYFKRFSGVEHSSGAGYNAVLEAEVEGIDIERSFAAEEIVSEMDSDSLLVQMKLSDVISFVESMGYTVTTEE